MSVVIDLNLVCIICLQDGELCSIYDRDDATDLSISEKIMKCSEIVLHEDSKLPDKICAECLQDLAATYRFRQNCETANSVFRTIQEHDDVLADLELEQHKIKIPSGLKIKRIQPETKTYILPVPVEQKPEPEEEVDGEQLTYAGDGMLEQIEEEPMEEVELDDYYEAEEVLEEQYQEEIVEIKVEKQDTHMVREKEQPVITELDIKREDEGESTAEENTQPTIHQAPKRGRGRPKKTQSKQVVFQASVNNEKEKSRPTVRTLPTAPPRANSKNDTAKPSVLKSISVMPSRKRKSTSPDSKPTKICDICGNSYKYQHALNAHMRRHNNDRPFSCEFCEKAFVSAVELLRHMRVHTGDKPYACQYCERRFSDFGSRIKHERTHTGERPYHCSTCGKAFAYAHVLSVHLRTHTGEKKFKCSHCGKGFTKKAYLETHVEQHARAAVEAADIEAEDKNVLRGDLISLKNVAMEECIFTTHYIDGEVVTAVTEEEHMTEEHLEDNDGDEDHEAYVYPHIIKVETKLGKGVAEPDDSNYNSVA